VTFILRKPPDFESVTNAGDACMGDRIELESVGSQAPLPRGESPLTRRARPRGFVQQVSTVLIQPGLFFRSLLAAGHESRQWLWAAILILALVGISAVRHEALAGAGADTVQLPPGASGPGGPPMSGPAGPAGPGGPSIPGSAAGMSDVAATWTTALLAASGVIVAWIVVAALLSLVPMFNGVAPSFARNMQIAVWASMPLGLMAALQLIYYSAGGMPGEAGISGLLTQWSGYADLPVFLQSVVLSLTSQLTIFWVWNLVLIGLGARLALGGKRWAAAFVVLIWIVLVVVTPVAVGTTRAPLPEAPEIITLP
jgi:hypothetical protein